jgi:hypothetical protein
VTEEPPAATTRQKKERPGRQDGPEARLEGREEHRPQDGAVEDGPRIIDSR